jgi:hypothetical protein
MRNDITYGMRDYEISDSAIGMVMLEILFYSFMLGKQTQTEYGVATFLVTLLLLSSFRFFAKVIFFVLTVVGTGFIYQKLEVSQTINLTYLFTAIAFLFLYRLHNNAFYYYHEPEYEYYEEE